MIVASSKRSSRDSGQEQLEWTCGDHSYPPFLIGFPQPSQGCFWPNNSRWRNTAEHQIVSLRWGCSTSPADFAHSSATEGRARATAGSHGFVLNTKMGQITSRGRSLQHASHAIKAIVALSTDSRVASVMTEAGGSPVCMCGKARQIRGGRGVQSTMPRRVSRLEPRAGSCCKHKTKGDK